MYYVCKTSKCDTLVTFEIKTSFRKIQPFHETEIPIFMTRLHLRMYLQIFILKFYKNIEI